MFHCGNIPIQLCSICPVYMLHILLHCLCPSPPGYSVKQLHTLCVDLAASAEQLPHLQHMSLGMELDTLLSDSQKSVLNPLGQLTHLTSLAITDYQ